MIPGLIAQLWQSTLFAGAAWLLALTLRKNQARVRYGVWFVASAKFLIPFSLLVGLGALVPRRAAVPAIQSTWMAVAEQVAQPLATFPAVAARATATAEGAHPNYFVAAAIGLWVCGFVAIAGCWLLRWKRVHALRKAATPVRIPNAMEFAVPVMSAPGLVEPGIVGILRPVLLLPKGIEDQLESAQLDAILVHELCHVRRHDDLTATVHMAVQAIFWFHPLIWWLGARLVDERERACDEEVLRIGCKPQVYAAGILNVCKLYVESPLVCVSGVTGANLKRRIEAIMRKQRGIALNRTRKALLATGAIAALAGPIVMGVMIGVGEAPAIRAQATAPVAERLTFDAASLKPVALSARPGIISVTGGPGSRDPGRYHNPYKSLKSFLMDAYGVQDYQVAGPVWLDSESFDIEATMPADTTKEQFKEMLQNLLSDRFKLAFHRETKEVPSYSLLVAKGGPKMRDSSETQAATDDHPQRPQTNVDGFPVLPPTILSRPGILILKQPDRARLIVTQQTTGEIASYLAGLLGRPVRDATKLVAKYDSTLTFGTEGTRLAYVPLGPVPTPEGEVPPDLLIAVQEQLGLRLEAGKGPVEVIVVDHIEKTPTEN